MALKGFLLQPPGMVHCINPTSAWGSITSNALVSFGAGVAREERTCVSFFFFSLCMAWLSCGRSGQGRRQDKAGQGRTGQGFCISHMYFASRTERERERETGRERKSLPSLRTPPPSSFSFAFLHPRRRHRRQRQRQRHPCEGGEKCIIIKSKPPQKEPCIQIAFAGSGPSLSPCLVEGSRGQLMIMNNTSVNLASAPPPLLIPGTGRQAGPL